MSATDAARFAPIALDELNARAALLSRVDNKYIIDAPTVSALFERLEDDFLVLEIDGRRLFTYHTVYFDSEGLDLYHAHVQRRRRRFKCRSRCYVETGRNVFELKLKGLRGRTVKHQLEIDAACHGAMSADTRAFAERILREAYGYGLERRLEPVLPMTYQRVTLAAREGAERVTCDFSLDFGTASLADGHAIIESKSGNGRGAVDRHLRALGVRPITSCSKYCAGIGLTRQGVRTNPFGRLLRQYYVCRPPATA
ncbi:MAG TPA: polyphosphate polymerase domain-containing protein [Solirubrobacteraceae bacterium]